MPEFGNIGICQVCCLRFCLPLRNLEVRKVTGRMRVATTRLPGEIAGAYGVTAAVIVRIQHRARLSKLQKEAAARRKGIERLC